MTTFPVIGARAELDVDQYNRNVRDVIQSAGRVDDALDMIVASALDAQGALNRIRGDVNVDVQVDDSQLDNAKRKREDISGTESVDVNVEDNEIRDARNLLEDIRNIQVITIGIDVVMGGVGAVTGGIGGILETITDQQQAVATFAARSNVEVANAANIIETLYRGAWGDTRVEIAGVVSEIANMGATGESEIIRIADSAFSIAQVFDQDVNEVLRSARVLSENFGISFEDALDVITVGFQSGLNIGDDFLETINEYSNVFEDLGFDVNEFFSFLSGGLQAGAFDADRLADSIKEGGIRLNEIVAGGGTESQLSIVERFGLEGMIDEFRETGVVAGDEFFRAFIARGNEMVASGEMSMAEFQAASVEIFGTMAEDLGVAIVGAAVEAAPGFAGAMGGAASAAGALINDNIGTAWTSFTRTAQGELTAALDTAFDITGLINDARDAMLAFSAEIAAGNTFGGALEVALQIPGLEAFINDLSTAFNNLIIGMFEVAREIIRALGGDVEDISNTISRLGSEQFEFEIFTSENVDDVENAIRNAVNRGVPVDEISRGISEAVTARVEAGDVGGAQDIVDNLTGIEVPITIIPEIAEGLDQGIDIFGLGTAAVEGTTIPLDVAIRYVGGDDALSEAQSIVGEAAQAATDEFNAALERGNLGQARAIARDSGIESLIEAGEQIADWRQEAETANRVTESMGEGFDDMTAIIEESNRIITRTTASFNDQFIAAKAMAGATGEAGDAASRTANFYAALEGQLAGSLDAWDNYNKKASDALSILSALSGLSLPSVADVAAAAAAVNAAGATGNTTNNTTNVTNNNQSAAEVNAANNASGARGRS